jgi:hypothetical protein
MLDGSGGKFQLRVKSPLLRGVFGQDKENGDTARAAGPRTPDSWRMSYTALLVSNAVPLVGALFLEWDVFTILFLFWAENVIIGVFNMLRMAAASPPGNVTNQALKIFLIPFFVVHYGGFCFVHGVFVIALFGGGFQGLDFPNPFARLAEDFTGTLAFPLLGLAVSHGISFFDNYLRGGEFRRTTVDKLMHQPYARIVVLHLTITAGGLLVEALGSPAIALALLVVLKTVVDLVAHRRERRKFAATAQEPLT